VTAEPIVFIPGFMCDARAFLPQIVQLGATHACQVILPSGEETVERLAEVVLANAPVKFVAIGHGLGGDVVMDVLRRAPERVLRVVLISTDPLAEAPKAAAAREARIVAAKSGRLVQAAAEDYPEIAFAQTEWQAEVLSLIHI
jgi:pimeloyl-ACP methyl ester carboxylesterase